MTENMDYEKFRKEFLGNIETRKEFEEYDLAFEVAKILIAARVAKKLTQAQVAKEIKTKQSGIARAESGDCLPSLSFLNKIAKFYDTDLIPPKFRFMEEAMTQTNTIDETIGKDIIRLTVDDILYTSQAKNTCSNH